MPNHTIIKTAIRVYCALLVLLSLTFASSQNYILSTLSYTIIYLLISYLAYKLISIVTKSVCKFIKNIIINSIYYFLFKIIKDSKYCYLFLNNNLDIIFINKAGHAKFKLNNQKIQGVIPNFHYYFLINKQFKFKSLNPAIYKTTHSGRQLKADNLLTADLHATYSNSYVYDNTVLNFTARPFKIFNYPIGLIVEFDFTSKLDSIEQKKVKNTQLYDFDFIDALNI